MKIGLKTCVAVMALTWGSAAFAQSAPTITVTPYLAVNAFGSPSYAAQIANQNNALLAGTTAAGTPGTPSYYHAQSNILTTDLIVTNFASYGGVANPSGAYASELGTRAAFGLFVNGNGTLFNIAALSLAVVGTGNSGEPAGGNYNATPYLNFTRAPGSYNYGDGYVGILFGANGVLGGGDDTYVTSGSNLQLVNALVGRGSGTAYSVTCGTTANDFGPCSGDLQSYIDDAAGGYPFPSTYTGTYSLLGATGSGSFNVSAPPSGVPEPGTWAMMICGFGLVGFALRTSQSRASELA